MRYFVYLSLHRTLQQITQIRGTFQTYVLLTDVSRTVRTYQQSVSIICFVPTIVTKHYQTHSLCVNTILKQAHAFPVHTYLSQYKHVCILSYTASDACMSVKPPSSFFLYHHLTRIIIQRHYLAMLNTFPVYTHSGL